MISLNNDNEGLQCITVSKCHSLYKTILSITVLVDKNIARSEIVHN